MKKWFAKSSKLRRPGAHTSRPKADSYVQLPKSLNDLSRGYKELVRELGKR